MTKKREPIKVIIENPEAVPIARQRLTLGLLELREKRIKEAQMSQETETIVIKA